MSRGGTGRRPRVAALIAGALVLATALGCDAGAGPRALEVGDCIDPPAVVGDIATLRPLPCEQPHGGEVFLAEDLPDGVFPGDDGFADFVTARCIPAYEDYTGFDLMTQDDMDIGWLPPTEDSWAGGDRRIVCYATPFEQGHKTTGSIRKP